MLTLQGESISGGHPSATRSKSICLSATVGSARTARRRTCRLRLSTLSLNPGAAVTEYQTSPLRVKTVTEKRGTRQLRSLAFPQYRKEPDVHSRMQQR